MDIDGVRADAADGGSGMKTRRKSSAALFIIDGFWCRHFKAFDFETLSK